MQGFIKLLQQLSKGGTWRNDIIDSMLEYCIYFEVRVSPFQVKPSTGTLA